MADQSNLTFGGIGADPTGAYTAINTGWSEAQADGVRKFQTPSTGLGITDTSVDGTQYSQVLTVIGGALKSAHLDIVASGDAGCTCAWQWFNSKGTSHDGTGDQAGGTWTDIGTAAADYAAQTLDAGVTTDWAAMQQASQWRVKVVCLSSADVKTTLNAADSAMFWVVDDRTAELNDTINNPVTFGGIGQDPS